MLPVNWFSVPNLVYSNAVKCMQSVDGRWNRYESKQSVTYSPRLIGICDIFTGSCAFLVRCIPFREWKWKAVGLAVSIAPYAPVPVQRMHQFRMLNKYFVSFSLRPHQIFILAIHQRDYYTFPFVVVPCRLCVCAVVCIWFAGIVQSDCCRYYSQTCAYNWIF